MGVFYFYTIESVFDGTTRKFKRTLRKHQTFRRRTVLAPIDFGSRRQVFALDRPADVRPVERAHPS